MSEPRRSRVVAGALRLLGEPRGGCRGAAHPLGISECLLPPIDPRVLLGIEPIVRVQLRYQPHLIDVAVAEY